MRRHLSLAIAVLATTTACAREPSAPAAVVVQRAVPVDEVTVADVYSPDGADDAPVVVLLHGGEGQRELMGPSADALARAGIVVYVPSWPVIPIGFEGEVTTELYAEQARAVVCSLRYARLTAEDHGGDPTELTVVGHSAGGAAGARAALVDEPPWPGIDCFPGVDHRPSRFVGSAGDYNGVSQYAERAPDIYAPFSPLQIEPTNTDLEVALVQGFDDTNVYPSAAIDFRDRLLDVGMVARLLHFDGGHGELIDPTTAAGAFLVDQVDAMVHDLPTAFDVAPASLVLRYGDATCTSDVAGGTSGSDAGDGTYGGAAEGSPITIELRNDSAVPVWFSLVAFVTRSDAEAAAASAGAVDRVPPGVSASGFRRVAPSTSDELTWVFLHDDATWWLYCLPAVGSDDPAAGQMLPAAELLRTTAGTG